MRRRPFSAPRPRMSDEQFTAVSSELVRCTLSQSSRPELAVIELPVYHDTDRTWADRLFTKPSEVLVSLLFWRVRCKP